MRQRWLGGVPAGSAAAAFPEIDDCFAFFDASCTERHWVLVGRRRCGRHCCTSRSRQTSSLHGNTEVYDRISRGRLAGRVGAPAAEKACCSQKNCTF